MLSGTQTLAGADAVAGAGGLTKSGSGTLTLNGANANYTGATTVTGGLINFNAANNFGSGQITLNGGGLQWATGTTTDISSRLAALGTGGGTFDTNGNNVAFASSLSGSGGLTKAGTGTLTLSVANSYLGGTTVNAGNLQISGAGTLGNTGSATTINGGTLDLGGTTQTQNGGLTLTGGTLQNGTLSSSGIFDMQSGTVSAVLTGAGSLQKTTAGTVTLSGANTYTGATTITTGTLALSGFGDVSSSSSVTVGNGATFDVSASGFFFVPIATLAGSGTVQLGGNGLVIVNGSTEFSGAINGGGGLEIFSGTQTLSGINSYTNVTQIDRGATLALKGAGSIASSSYVGFNSLGSGLATLDISQTSSGASVGGLADSAGIGRVSLGSQTLTITNGSSFAGVIQDGGIAGGTGGSLIISAPGFGQDLSGVNTYTGSTTITGNALLTLSGNGSIASSSGLNLTGAGATFDISASSGNQTIKDLSGVAGSTIQLGANSLTVGTANSTSFAGSIDGSGGLVKAGTGTLTFSGANSYTGNTSITNGTLTLTGAGTLGAITNAVTVNGATAILNLGGTTQTQNGGVSLQAGGTIQNGTLSSTATFDMQSGTVSAALAGTGALIKSGTSTVTLSGVNTYTGPTTVNGGTLSVNGSIASSSGLTVNAGGSIGGNGILPSTTINGGTLAPGNSIGTLSINGNLVLTSAAAYIVEVSPTQADRTNVTGTATLAGTVQAVFGPGSYIARTYTILSAAGGRSGTFGSLTTSGLPAGLAAALSYTGTDAILNLTAVLGQQPTTPGQQPLPNGALSGNQLNVANSLNGFFNNGGTLPPGFVTIFGLTGGNLGNALSQLSGEAATGAQQAGFQMGSQFLNLMLDPFVDGRSGVAGTSGPALGFAPERDAALPSDIALAYSSVLKAPAMQAQPYAPRWSAWGGAYGGSNKTSGDPAVLGSHDLAARTAGFAGGLDYRLSPDSVVGLALAGGGTNWSLANGLGGGKSDAFQAGIYGATKYGPAYLAAAFAFTNHWMSTDRFAVGDHLTASFNAQSYGGRIESGYRFATWYGGITPYAAIQAQSFRTPGYSETDTTGGGFALAYNSRTGTDTRSELGTRFDRVLALYTNAVLSLRARVAWAHDWVSDPMLAPVFQALPGASFIVNGATPAKNSALASAGTELRLANGIALLAKFDGEFASRSSTYAGTGTVRYTW